jgi:hypothetical protein
MKQLLSFAILVALVATFQGSASAAQYHLTVRNNSTTPVDFAVYQSDASASGFRSMAVTRQLCVQPKNTTHDSFQLPTAVTVQAKQPEFEVVFVFKDATCAGRVIDTQRLTVSDPNGTYTITRDKAHYIITH